MREILWLGCFTATQTWSIKGLFYFQTTTYPSTIFCWNWQYLKSPKMIWEAVDRQICAFEKVFLTILQYIRSVKHFPVCDQHVWHVLHIILSLYLLVALLWLVWTFVLCVWLIKAFWNYFCCCCFFFSASIILKYLRRINRTTDVAHN